MEAKNRPVQLDLFGREREEAPARPSFFKFLSSHIVLSLENIIVAAIFMSLAVLLAFSLGVEKGKRQAHRALMPQTEMSKAARPAPALNSASTPAAPVIKEKAQALSDRSGVKSELAKTVGRTDGPLKIAAKSDGNKYIVQLACYRKDDFVRQEESRLKAQGYQTIVRTSGQLRVLSVGAFDNKQAAEVAVKQLRSRYTDCFIRRL